MTTTGEMKEPTTTATLEDGGGGEGAAATSKQGTPQVSPPHPNSNTPRPPSTPRPKITPVPPKGPPPEATLLAALFATSRGGGEGEGELVKCIPSLASRLNKRADLLRRILSFHETKSPKDYINLRSSSKFFHRALQPPPPLWTMFPHSNYATLQSLVDRLEELRGDEESSGNVPSVLFIEQSVYGGEGGRYIYVKKPLSMYGAGRGKTTLVGVGLKIQGNKSDGIVEIEDLTIKGGEGHGLYVSKGMNVIMRGCSVDGCQGTGVVAHRADISCDNLQVVGCGGSGVSAQGNATITLSGQGTTIQRNVTKGYYDDYGLHASSAPSSNIHLVHPLTKKQISTNNGGGRNWGGVIRDGGRGGTIEQISK